MYKNINKKDKVKKLISKYYKNSLVKYRKYLTSYHFQCINSVRCIGLDSVFFNHDLLYKLLNYFTLFKYRMMFVLDLVKGFEFSYLLTDTKKILINELFFMVKTYFKPQKITIINSFLNYELKNLMLSTKLIYRKKSKEIFLDKIVFKNFLKNYDKRSKKNLLLLFSDEEKLFKYNLLFFKKKHKFLKIMNNIKKKRRMYFRRFKKKFRIKRKKKVDKTKMGLIKRKFFFRFNTGILILNKTNSNWFLTLTDLNNKIIVHYSSGFFTYSLRKRDKLDFRIFEWMYTYLIVPKLNELKITNLLFYYKGTFNFGIRRLFWGIRKSRRFLMVVKFKLKIPHNSGMRKKIPRRL